MTTAVMTRRAFDMPDLDQQRYAHVLRHPMPMS
jgi:hypothetical protein